MKLALVGALLCAVCLSAEARAQTVELPLQASASVVNLQIQGPLLFASGRASDYSGLLSLNVKDFTRSVVTISADLSKVSLQAERELSGLNLQPLFASIPNPRGSFTSTNIRKLGAGSYLVTGKWVRAGKSQQLEFPVELVKANDRRAEVRIKLTRDIDVGESERNLMPFMAGSSGRADAVLIFSR